MKIKKTVTSKLVRNKRKALGLTQEELSLKIGSSKSAQFISNIERSLCLLPLKSMKRTARVLKLQVDDLFEAYMHDHREKALEWLNG